MIFDTIIARHSDGLFLSETYDENSEGIAKAKRKVKQLLKVSISYEEDVLRTVEVEGYHLQYKIFDGVIYLALCDKNYNRKLANSYLDALHNAFFDELQNHYGTQSIDYRSKIETIEEPYHFLKFDKQMKKVKVEFQDSKSNSNIERIKNDLTQIHSTVAENIDKLIERTGKLDDTLSKTAKVLEDSKKWKDKTKKLEWDMWLKKNMTILVIVCIVLFFILFKFVL